MRQALDRYVPLRAENCFWRIAEHIGERYADSAYDIVIFYETRVLKLLSDISLTRPLLLFFSSSSVSLRLPQDSRWEEALINDNKNNNNYIDH